MADLTTGTAPRRRGRPKGTGIDDTMLLRQIVGLMATNPALKPTTAIKQVGIDNPSIVRRLREKLKATKIEAPALPPSRRRAARKSSAKSDAHPAPLKHQATRQTTNPIERATRDNASPPSPPKPAPPAQDATAKDPHKAREAALLAAYLKALQATAVPALDDELQRNIAEPRAPQPQTSLPPSNAEAPRPEPELASKQNPRAAQPAQPPPNPFAAFAPLPQQQSPVMMFPFMPPFLQPFAPKPPPASPMAQNQMEALKLSVEVMTAVAKLQMYTYQNAFAGTPFGNMLQAQTMMGQMLLASFAGLMGGKKPSDKA